MAHYLFPLYTHVVPKSCPNSIFFVRIPFSLPLRIVIDFLVFSNSSRIIFFHFGDQKSETEAVLHARQKPPKKLRDVIEIYLRFNHGREYLLVNNRGGMLGQDGLGRTLLKLFGIGSTMIRKIYISEHTKDAHNVIESLASKMGHSATMARASYLKT